MKEHEFISSPAGTGGENQKKENHLWFKQKNEHHTMSEKDRKGEIMKKIAYVRASYFMKEGNSYSKTYQDYVLRQDEKGCWKILTFYKVEAGTDTETE